MKKIDKKKVSIIMYVKNGMPYFPEALESVLSQTLEDIEIIIVDGVSSDGTIEKVKQYMNNDARIQLLYCDRGSVGAQLNMGIKIAKGEYIGIVESDDRILPDMYKKEYEFAKQNGFPDIVRADNYIFFGQGDEETIIRTRVSHNEFDYGVSLSAKKEPDRVFIGGSYWTGIYKRDFLINNNILMHESKGAAYQDFGFLFQTSALADNIYIMNDAFYCYRKDNPQSSCNKPMGINLIENEYAFLKDKLIECGIWFDYKRYYYLWKIRNYLWFYNNLDRFGKKEVIPIMYKSIMEDLNDPEFPDDGWNKKESEVIQLLKKSYEAFVSYFESRDKMFADSYEKIYNISPSDNICIFGAGNIAVIIMIYFKRKNIIPKFVLDNNKKLWGSRFNDIDIISPEVLNDKKNLGNIKVIICSENYMREIKDQVESYGIDKNDIITCDDMDSCVRMILRTFN